MHSPQPPHQVLKRQWPAILCHSNDLSFQDSRVDGDLPSDLPLHLRQTGSQIGEIAGEEPHALALLVDLHPGAVQLVFQRKLRTEQVERLLDRGSGLG